MPWADKMKRNKKIEMLSIIYIFFPFFHPSILCCSNIIFNIIMLGRKPRAGFRILCDRYRVFVGQSPQALLRAVLRHVRFYSVKRNSCFVPTQKKNLHTKFNPPSLSKEKEKKHKKKPQIAHMTAHLICERHRIETLYPSPLYITHMYIIFYIGDMCARMHRRLTTRINPKLSAFNMHAHRERTLFFITRSIIIWRSRHSPHAQM